MHLPGIGNIERLGETAEEIQARADSLQAMFPSMEPGSALSVVMEDAVREETVRSEKKAFPWLLVLGAVGGAYLLFRPKKPAYNFSKR